MIADVKRIGSGPPRLLVEVPHGADRRAHYDALLAELNGPFPADLHCFFHINTDVGAWDLGEWVARELGVSAILIRCLIPRTFVDTNRFPGDRGGDLTKGGATPGLQPYVRDPDDIALLLDRHHRYLALCTDAYAEVCGAGGLALIPHTYGPKSLGLERVDDDIVEALKRAHAPAHYATCTWRKEVDLITVTPEGDDLAPPGLTDALEVAYAAAGFDVGRGATYNLHPSTMGAVWAARYPHQTVSLEVRRDLLVPEWTPFDEMIATPDRIARAGRPLVAALGAALGS